VADTDASPIRLPVLRTTSGAADRRIRLEEDTIALFDRFRGPLLGYIAGFGVAYSDGEEIVQEVFLALFQHLQNDKSRENLAGWLFRVAHNLALKRRWRARRDSEGLIAGVDLVIDPGANPEDQAADSQFQQRLRAAVGALADQDRNCLFLRAEGLRYREIARMLEMSLGAVSNSLARSLARIARCANR